jgi:hypothetical protein
VDRLTVVALARRYSIVPITTALLANSVVSPSAQVPQATVVVHNRARLLRHTLADAQTIVDRIFLAAGVRLVWRRPAPSGVLTSSDMRTIRIIIVPRETAQVIGYRRDSLAFTPGASRGTASLAYVLAHRIAAVSRGYRVPLGIVLGSAIAHEMGHMLLSGRHSRQGMMQANFNQADFRKIAAGELGFSEAEAADMRARMSVGDVHPRTARLCETTVLMQAVGCPTPRAPTESIPQTERR